MHVCMNDVCMYNVCMYACMMHVCVCDHLGRLREESERYKTFCKRNREKANDSNVSQILDVDFNG